jgi:integrase
MAKKRRGRPRGSNPNRHLFVGKGGTWWLRYSRQGFGDVREHLGYPRSEVAAARIARDKRIRQLCDRRLGVEELPPVVTVGKLVDLYLAAESNEYDREKGGVQPGRKRGAGADRVVRLRLERHLDFNLSADLVDKERLLDAAASMVKAGRVVHTKAGPRRAGDLSGLTIRNAFRLLRRVYGWARSNKRKTGVVANPFDELDAGERRRLFPREVARKAPPFKREELRRIYDLLPAHVARPVRFDAHTGMRWRSELLRMEWGRVDLERRVYRIDPRWAKNGKEREVPLGDVALEILRQVRPPRPKATDPVWLNAEGGPLLDARGPFVRRIRKVCSPPQTGWRYPDFHSLRRSCATALSHVAPKAVTRAVLGHGAEDVTDLYVTVTVEDQLAALNRAALLIDGDPGENVVALAQPRKKARA